MPLQVTENLELSTTSAVACGICTLLIFRALFFGAKHSNAPSIEWTGTLLSWITAAKSVAKGHLLFQQGYNAHKPGPFSVRVLGFGTMVFLTGEDVREEMRKTPDEIISQSEGVNQTMEAYYAFGPRIVSNKYHVGLVTSGLTRNLEAVFPDVYDELSHACEDELPVKDDGSWSTFTIGSRMKRIISRSSNRVIVGLPLCRDPEWRDLQISYTISTFKDIMKIKVFPEFLKPFAAKYFTQGRQRLEYATRLMTPLLDERMSMAPQDRPNDFLTWYMAEAPKYPGEMTYEALTNRVLLLNIAAIHTTSMTAQLAVYDLALRPEYADPLREEVEEMTQKYGWTKKAINSMRKLDSFVRESQRLCPLASMALGRVVKRDHILSDGTFLPKGSWVATSMQGVHLDESIYPNASQFDGFRFSRLPDSENACNQAVSTSQTWLVYGHGSTACPGRFFAANEVKTLLALLLVSYDIKMKDPNVSVEPTYIGTSVLPNDNVEVCFRKRVGRV